MKIKKNKLCFVVRYYEDNQISYGGYWVEKLFEKKDENEAIEFYMKHISCKPTFYLAYPLKINLGIKVKLKAFLRQFKIPATITIKDIFYEEGKNVKN